MQRLPPLAVPLHDADFLSDADSASKHSQGSAGTPRHSAFEVHHREYDAEVEVHPEGVAAEDEARLACAGREGAQR